MSNRAVVWATSLVGACWLIVIAHQLGWSVIDPQKHDFWRATLYTAYPTVFVTTGAFLAAVLLLALKK